MLWNKRSRCALTTTHKSYQRRLTVESLEGRDLLAAATAMPTPAAIDAESVAAAIQASSPSAPSTGASGAAGVSDTASLPSQALAGTDQMFITTVYNNLLGRSPGPGEVQYWQGYLGEHVGPIVTGGAAGLGSTVTNAAIPGYALVESPATNFATASVPVAPNNGTGISVNELDTGPGQGSSEMNYGLTQAALTNGGYAGASAGVGTGSLIPSTNLPSLIGAGAVYGGSNGGIGLQQSRLSMVQQVLASPEYQHRVVNQLYQDFLHRSAGNQALTYWSQQLGTLGEKGVLVQILASNEYFQNAGGTNAGYVNALYHDILGRDPGAQGSDYWVSQIESRGGGGQARAEIASGILDSPEASRLLVINPTHDALAAITDGGYDQQFFQGGLTAAQEASYIAGAQSNITFENLISSMVVGSRYYQRQDSIASPGPGDNPAQISGRAG